LRTTTEPNRYAALPSRGVEPVQTAHLKERFDLAPRSLPAEETVRLTNAALVAHEARTGTERVVPGEPVIERNRKSFPTPSSPRSGAASWPTGFRLRPPAGTWSTSR